MLTVRSDNISELTRGSIVKMSFKKSMLSVWTRLLWFSKVREKMERRSRSEGSVTHSSRNSSISFFSSLMRSSQTLKKNNNKCKIHFDTPMKNILKDSSPAQPSGNVLMLEPGMVLPCPEAAIYQLNDSITSQEPQFASFKKSSQASCTTHLLTPEPLHVFGQMFSFRKLCFSGWIFNI